MLGSSNSATGTTLLSAKALSAQGRGRRRVYARCLSTESLSPTTLTVGVAESADIAGESVLGGSSERRRRKRRGLRTSCFTGNYITQCDTPPGDHCLFRAACLFRVVRSRAAGFLSSPPHLPPATALRASAPLSTFLPSPPTTAASSIAPHGVWPR